MTKDDFTQYRFVLLPGGGLPSRNLLSLYNQAYNNWKKIWKRVMTHLEGKGSYRSDPFVRQDFVAMIMKGDEVCCQTTAKLFRLEEDWARDSSYFEVFDDHVIELLKENSAEYLMSIEHNSINAKFSKRRTQFGYVEAMLYTMVHLARTLSVDACLGVTRNVTGVQDTVTKMGFRTIKSGLSKHNCPVEIQVAYMQTMKDHPVELYHSFIQHLWETRLDFRFPKSYENKNKISAA